MHFRKLILFISSIVLLTVDIHASRIKKDLLLEQEEKIVALLKEKITILDKLIIEAQTYKRETDPLIQESFLNTPNLFYTQSKKDAISIRTGSASSVVYNRKGEVYGVLNGTIRDTFKFELKRPRIGESTYEREIFNIKMKSNLTATTSFSNQLNLYTILGNVIKEEVQGLRNTEYMKEILIRLDNIYEGKFQSMNIELMRKYFKFISLISSNDISSHSKAMIILESIDKWHVHSRMFTFVFSLRKDKLYKKKTYDLSQVLNDTFNRLHKKESINLSKTPEYYDRKINKDLKCIETAQDLKYKGRICINDIDVDKDIYFKYGTFESRENNFIQSNKEHFKSLIALDDKLKKSSQDYVEFVILKVSSPTKKTEINLEGGL